MATIDADEHTAAKIHLEHSRRQCALRKSRSRTHEGRAQGVQQSADRADVRQNSAGQIGEARTAETADTAQDSESRTTDESFRYTEGSTAESTTEKGTDQDRTAAHARAGTGELTTHIVGSSMKNI